MIRKVSICFKKSENGRTDVLKRCEDCNKFKGQVGKILWGSIVRGKDYGKREVRGI